MNLGKILPGIAVIGIIFAMRTVVSGNTPSPIAEAYARPATPPFPSYVAGAGIVEANTENIAIAAEVGGVISKVFVVVGKEVKAGDPLFLIDSRQTLSDLEVKRAALEVAKVEAADLKSQLAMWERVADKRALSAEEFSKKKYASDAATARVNEATYAIQSLETQLDRLTVKAPVDGTVLQVKARPGEYAPATVTTQPLMLLGNTKPLHVRVDVDENDAWRIKEGAKGKAFLRGNPYIGMDLEFVRFEPYIIPKRSLTGESTERVDTRVLQIIYRVSGESPNAYVGQLLDVFVEAPSSSSTM